MRTSEFVDAERMPHAIPLVHGWEIEARHVVEAPGAAAGSQWFDVFILESGWTVLLMGDVPSVPDPTASAAQVRALVREAFVRHHDLATAWSVVATTLASRQARAAAVALDPWGRSLWCATAAHRGPTLIDDTGARQLTSTGSPASGAASGRPEHVELGDGSVTLVLTSSDAAGLPELGAPEAPARVGATNRDVPGEPYAGHVVSVLIARRSAPPDPLHIRVEGELAALRQVRASLENWLTVLGAGPMDSLTVVHAALELVTNAVEHAYPPGIRDAEVEVRCNWTVTGEVVIDVVDHGEWRTPTYDVARGRGLAMAAGLVHELEVTTDPQGTRAQLRHRPTRPVVDRHPPCKRNALLTPRGAGRSPGTGAAERSARQ